MVAWSHLPNRTVMIGQAPVNVGVVAVCVFFMLSGYVVAGLLRPGSAMSGSPILFYRERALRILPLYLLFMLVAAFTSSRIPHPAHGPAAWAANLAIIPLDFFAFFPQHAGLMFDGPTWSLGLELQFYLLAPFLLRRRWVAVIAAVGSLAFQAAVSVGHLNSDTYGYRLLPGTLFLFLVGAGVCWWRERRMSLLPIATAWGACVALSVHLSIAHRWDEPYFASFQLGCLVGIPLVVALSTLRRRSWDHRFGELSYGVFLAHHPLIDLGIAVGFTAGDHVVLFFALALLLAYVAHRIVERRVEGVRRAMRDRSSVLAQPLSPSRLDVI